MTPVLARTTLQAASAVEAACKELLGRTGGSGFPILCDALANWKIGYIKRGVERAGATALIYQWNSKDCCSEGEVEQWLRRRRSGKEEKRVLITDHEVSRGWEASHVLVVSLTGFGWENEVMRTVGYCALVRLK